VRSQSIFVNLYTKDFGETMAWEPSCWAYSWTPEKSRYAAKETSSPNGMATCADHGTSATRGSKTAKSQSIKRSQPTIILSQASGEKGLLEDVMRAFSWR
jgi:hypothetical protein